MDLREQLKVAMIKELKLTDVEPQDIEPEAPLFDDGLGLDSLDAVELVVMIQRDFGVEIENMDEGKEAFKSLNALAAYIEARQ